MKLLFLLTIFFVSFFSSNAFPDVKNIAEVVSYARFIVDTIKNSTLPPDFNEVDSELAEKINSTRRSLARMIERKMKRPNGQETLMKGIRNILKRDNFTFFIMTNEDLNLLPANYKLQVNINKILNRSLELIDDLPRVESRVYSVLRENLFELKDKLHLNSEGYDQAVEDLYDVTGDSEFKFNSFEDLARQSKNLFVSPETFQSLSQGILESRNEEISDKMFQMFAKIKPRSVPGFYKAIYGYFVNNHNNFKFEDTCDVEDLYQDEIMEIYDMALLIDFRVFMMTIATRRYMQIQQEGNYDGELLIEIQNFINRAEHYLKALKNILSKAPRDIKRCDPDSLDQSSFLSNSSTKVVSLIPQIADIKNNMVVTNVRLQEVDNLVHMQIQQGLLLPGGAIDERTLKWVPVDTIVRAENESSFQKFHKVKGDERVPLVKDRDFSYLNPGERLNVDDINLPVDYVITGISFKKMLANDVNQWNSNAIGLQVHATPINYYDGTLVPTKSKPSEWLTANEQLLFDIFEETWIKYEVPRINKFVHFSASNNSQVLLPFLDSRAAGIRSSTSLSGVGVVERKTGNNESFLVPKLIAVDHSEHVIAKLPSRLIEHYTRSQDYYEDYEDYVLDDSLIIN